MVFWHSLQKFQKSYLLLEQTSCFDCCSWDCLRCYQSITEPFIHIPQFRLHEPWEAIWIFPKDSVECILQGFVCGTQRKTSSDSSSHIHLPSTSGCKNISPYGNCFILSSFFFCSPLSVLSSINPATLFHSFLGYSTPHSVSSPPWRDPRKGLQDWKERNCKFSSNFFISILWYICFLCTFHFFTEKFLVLQQPWCL